MCGNWLQGERNVFLLMGHIYPTNVKLSSRQKSEKNRHANCAGNFWLRANVFQEKDRKDTFRVPTSE